MPDATSLRSQPPVRAFLVAIIVLALIFVVSLVLYFLGIGTKPNTASLTANVNGNGEINAVQNAGALTPPLPPEPSVITSRTGSVTKVSAKAIEFESFVYNEKEKRYATANLTAQLTDETRFLEIDASTPLMPPMPGEQAPTPQLTAINLSSVKRGDTIQVFAETNIKKEVRFNATEIRRHRLTS